MKKYVILFVLSFVLIAPEALSGNSNLYDPLQVESQQAKRHKRKKHKAPTQETLSREDPLASTNDDGDSAYSSDGLSRDTSVEISADNAVMGRGAPSRRASIQSTTSDVGIGSLPPSRGISVEFSSQESPALEALTLPEKPAPYCSRGALEKAKSFFMEKVSQITIPSISRLLQEEAGAFVGLFLKARCQIDSVTLNAIADKAIDDGIEKRFMPSKNDEAAGPIQGSTCGLSIGSQIKNFVRSKMQTLTPTPKDSGVIKNYSAHIFKYVAMNATAPVCERVGLSDAYLEKIWDTLWGDEALQEAGHETINSKGRDHNRQKKCAPLRINETIGFVSEKIKKSAKKVKEIAANPEALKTLAFKVTATFVKLASQSACSAVISPYIYDRLWDRLNMDDIVEGYVLEPAYAAGSYAAGRAYDTAAYVAPSLREFGSYDFSGQGDEGEEEDE